MEKDNKKERDKARREYAESVRSLALSVKRRDKRWIEHEIKRRANEEIRAKEEKQKGIQAAISRKAQREVFIEQEQLRMKEQHEERKTM
jgi:hypothetical protein